MLYRRQGIQESPPVLLFELVRQFKQDTFEHKVDLSIGAYRTDDGQPHVLPCVVEAKRRILLDESLNHEYLPMDGLPEFREAARDLLFGDRRPSVEQGGSVVSVQTLSGTGALRLSFSFIARHKPNSTVYVPEPTWSNHPNLVVESGLQLQKYPYFDDGSGAVDEAGMLAVLQEAVPGSVVLLHACAHNPTGKDPSPEHWRAVADLCQERQLFPVFDSAYLGFASGDVSRDASALNLFVDRGLELFVTLSFSKNFGLYGERIGALLAVIKDHNTARLVQTQLKTMIRSYYSNPPTFGARVVSTVLTDPQLRSSWSASLRSMSDRIKSMRERLKAELDANGAPGDWSRLVEQIGMFSYTGLNAAQVGRLKDEFHIYMLPTGRASMAGLNPSNVKYVADAFKTVVEGTP